MISHYVKQMRRRDKVELMLIIVAAALAGALSRWLPHTLLIGEVALVVSALLLGQGLVRDLWIKYSLRKSRPACAITPGTKTQCICMESSLGSIGVLAGCLLLLAGFRGRVELGMYGWALLVFVVGVAGYLLKSVVIDWKTRRLRLEHNHENVTF